MKFFIRTAEITKSTIPLVIASDYVRPIILNEYRGLYIDLDFKLEKDITWLFKSTIFFSSYIYCFSLEGINNAMFASKPNHPILKYKI